ncbi:hypothetical protein FRC17_011213 [Serendipita sp. 399]|nr:hypothetical protein FRC17_011213 [Serendipita sp. 399]
MALLDYIPVVYDTTVIDVPIDGRLVELTIVDTPGQDDFGYYRAATYQGVHAFIICFSIDYPDSLENTYEKWVHEIERNCAGAPILLVGCKSDMRSKASTSEWLSKYGQRGTTREMGMAAARRVQAEEYLECSSKTNEGNAQRELRYILGAGLQDVWSLLETVIPIQAANRRLFDNRTVHINIDGQAMELVLTDTTSGQSQHDEARIRSYSNADAVIICFSIDRPESLRNVQDKWIPEILYFCQNIPIVVVGCKKDKRDDATAYEKLQKLSTALMTPEDGQKIANQIGAKAYLECSSATNDGVEAVFKHAAKATLVVRGRTDGWLGSLPLWKKIGNLLK